MKLNDVYKTIEKPVAEVLFKDKNSKFYGYAFPIDNEDSIKQQLNLIKKKHQLARHWCYAYQIGTETIQYRTNDDGEPNNSAGIPIYNQILSFNITNILVVVVRYFGGTKLGVSGLINAYKTTAQLTLEEAQIVEKFITKLFTIQFQYPHINQVMRIIKEKNITIVTQHLELECNITMAVKKSEIEHIVAIFNTLYDVKITAI